MSIPWREIDLDLTRYRYTYTITIPQPTIGGRSNSVGVFYRKRTGTYDTTEVTFYYGYAIYIENVDQEITICNITSFSIYFDEEYNMYKRIGQYQNCEPIYTLTEPTNLVITIYVDSRTIKFTVTIGNVVKEKQYEISSNKAYLLVLEEDGQEGIRSLPNNVIIEEQKEEIPVSLQGINIAQMLSFVISIINVIIPLMIITQVSGLLKQVITAWNK